MKPFHVFVEGPADKAFIQEALIRFGFGRNNDDRVTAFKGWTALVNTAVQKRLDDGDTVLVIFDADGPTRERGGFRNRLQAIREKLGSDLSDRVHIYLFPDNHSDGDLESVLAGLVPARHKTVIDECWTGYERCLTSKGYNSPSSKSRMHEYAAAIDPDVWKDQGFNKTFAKDTVWDWSSSALEPLKSFLREKLGDA